jgi:uncharacterized membrane protein required for colicin V production
LEPIEVLWIATFLLFGAIGLVRGFLKELGVTTAILVAIYIISELLEKRDITDRMMSKAVEAVPGTYDILATDDPRSALLRCMLYLLIMLVMVFISYHGETLTFSGTPPKGSTGTLYNLMVGLLNGYLVAGTIWYYLDKYDYPTRLLGLYQGELTARAEVLRRLLLFNLIPANFREPILLFSIFFLIIMRVAR